MKIQKCLNQASLEAEQFVQYILEFDPEKRPSATDCLRSPYLSDFHGETAEGIAIDEPSRPRPLDIAQFHFDYPRVDQTSKVREIKKEWN